MVTPTAAVPEGVGMVAFSGEKLTIRTGVGVGVCATLGAAVNTTAPKRATKKDAMAPDPALRCTPPPHCSSMQVPFCHMSA